jgi:hypothetical protein
VVSTISSQQQNEQKRMLEGMVTEVALLPPEDTIPNKPSPAAQELEKKTHGIK